MRKDTTLNQSPLPPLARGYPLLGNALAMNQDLITFLVEQYRLLGPIFRVRALNREFVVLAGPEANTFVTQQGADKFRSHEIWYEFGRELGAPHYMSAIDGEPHAQVRKFFKPGYSVGRFLSDIPVLVDIEKNVLNGIQVGKPMSALDLFRRIVTEQLSKALVNYELGDDNLESLMVLFSIAYKVHVAKQMPAFMLKLPSYQRAKRRSLKMGHKILAEHQAKTPDKKDLVDDALDMSQKPDFQGIPNSEDQMVVTALSPLFAGLDAVANECAFLLYELLNYPDLLAKCVAEADQLFSDGLPTQEQIRTYGVLHRAMLETLRLHSTAPAIIRTASRDFVFAGHRIREGQTVMIGTTVSHFLPELFPDPYRFDIERYSEGRREHKQLGAYTPFGVGPHTCLGAGAAEAQIVLVMATLLHMVGLERIDPKARLHVKQDPVPTLGDAFRISLYERKTGEAR